jgi:SAM-dependent methyltransferase
MANSFNPSTGDALRSDASSSPQPNYDQEIDIDVKPPHRTSSQKLVLVLHSLTATQHVLGREDDTDTTLGSESSSLRSISVTSSIYNYRYENGRRYHAYQDGKYLLPNDEAEQNRLDFYHHLCRLMIGGRLFRAPIGGNPQRVLDLGTGTGIWAIDFADEYPSALVIGTDLSPIQPNSVPPNCKFYVDDVESEWTFSPDETFDFIHGRALAGSIVNFDLLYRRIYDNLNRGGWVEMQEYEATFYSDDDPSLSKAPNCRKMAHLCNEASEKAGRVIAVAQEQSQKLINAGFEDVHDDAYKVRLRLGWPTC